MKTNEKREKTNWNKIKTQKKMKKNFDIFQNWNEKLDKRSWKVENLSKINFHYFTQVKQKWENKINSNILYQQKLLIKKKMKFNLMNG